MLFSGQYNKFLVALVQALVATLAIAFMSAEPGQWFDFGSEAFAAFGVGILGAFGVEHVPNLSTKESREEAMRAVIKAALGSAGPADLEDESDT